MLRRTDLWLSLTLFLLGAAVFKTASGYDEMPSHFPKLLAVAFVVLAVLLAAETLFLQKEKTGETLEPTLRFADPLLLVIGMVVYLRVIELAGYLIPSLLLFVFVGWMLGYRKVGRLAMTGLVAVAIVYSVFSLALGIPLPSPPWWPV